MADFIETTGNAPEAHITCLKKVTNAETGSAMYHVFVDNGDFYAAPISETTDAALATWRASNHTAADDAAFIEAISDLGNEHAYERCAAAVNARLEKVTERISTDGIHLYIDNDSASRLGIDAVLEDHLVKLMAKRAADPQAEYDFKCYAAFTENLYSNVDPVIRAQLVSWMTSQDWLTFTEDGCFIGYRGAEMMGGVPCSIHQGPAVVDGQNVNGHVPNPDGAIVEMPRSMVQNDPTVGCASGLHVGTYDYARGWARDVLLKVKVNPRDVVSVPLECDASKVRVCRFEVISHEEIDPGDNLREFYDRPLSWGYDGGRDWDDEDYDEDGYAPDGYDRDGYDRDGYDANGYDADGFDECGYDWDGYDSEGYDEEGFDRDGYDEEGYDRDGFNRDGRDPYGYDEYGYDADGFDESGYDRDGYDRNGCDRYGNTRADLSPDDDGDTSDSIRSAYEKFLRDRGL